MITVGVVGAGYIGPIHLEALSRVGGIKVKRVVDVTADFARKAAFEHNVPEWGTDYREIISDAEIDVVHNCTPNKFHFEITREALLAGKHVLSEKPLAMTLKQAEELVEIATKKRAANGIDFCYRYYPVVQEMRARVKRGDAGTVRQVSGSYFQDWLSRDTDWSWRLLPTESGSSNIVADLGSHWFDLAQFVTGLTVREVFADLATLVPVRRRPVRQVLAFEEVGEVKSEEVRVELEDYASVLFRLSNGAVGSFTTSQVCNGRKSDTELQVYGSDLSFAWNHCSSTTLWIGHRDRPNEVMIEGPNLQDSSAARYATLPAGHPLGYHDVVLNLMKDFYQRVDSASHEARNVPDFSAGLGEMKLLESILTSNERRKWVEVR